MCKEYLACARNVGKSKNLHGSRRTSLLHAPALVIHHCSYLTMSGTSGDKVTNVKRTLLYQNGCHGTTTLIQLSLDHKTSCPSVRVCLQLENVCGQQNRLQQILNALTRLCGHGNKLGISAPVGSNQLILGELLLYTLNVCGGLINLIYGNDNFDACCLCMVNCLNGLGHDTVICCNHENRNIRRICTTHTHCREGLMSRRIQERNVSSVKRNGVSTDMLRNTAGLALRNVRLTNGIQQGGFTMVNVTHDTDNGRSLLQILLVLVFLLQELLNNVNLNLLLAKDLIIHGERLSLLVGNLLIQSNNLALHEELLDQGCGLLLHLVRKILNRNGLRKRNHLDYLLHNLFLLLFRLNEAAGLILYSLVLLIHIILLVALILLLGEPSLVLLALLFDILCGSCITAEGILAGSSVASAKALTRSTLTITSAEATASAITASALILTSSALTIASAEATLTALTTLAIKAALTITIAKLTALTIEATLTVTIAILTTLAALAIEAALTVAVVIVLATLTIEAALAITIIIVLATLTALTIEAALAVTIVIVLTALTIKAALAVTIVIILTTLTVEVALTVTILRRIISRLMITICLIVTSALIRCSLRVVTICLRSCLCMRLLLRSHRLCGRSRHILCYGRNGRADILLGSLRCRSRRYRRSILYGNGRLYLFLLLRRRIYTLRLLRIARNHLYAGRGRRRCQRLNRCAHGLLLRSSVVVTTSIIIPRSSIITTLRTILHGAIIGTLSLTSCILLIIDNDDRLLLFRQACLSAALCGLCCGLCRLCSLFGLFCLSRFLSLLCLVSLPCFLSLLCLVSLPCFLSLSCLVSLLCILGLLCLVGLLRVSRSLCAAECCSYDLLLLRIKSTRSSLALNTLVGKKLQKLFIFLLQLFCEFMYPDFCHPKFFLLSKLV